MDDIRASIILEKNELMYLVSCLPNSAGNINASTLSEYTGIAGPDSRRAIAGLMQKNIICFAGNRLATVKLFDFYVKKLLGATKGEIIGGEEKMLVFDSPGFVLLVKGHRLSQNHISIQAYKTRQDLLEALEEAGEEQ